MFASSEAGVPRARRLVAVLAIGVLAVTACSDDDEGGATDTTATAPDGEGTEAPAPEEELECPGPEAAGEPVSVGVVWPEGATVDLPELGESAQAAADYANDCLGGLAGRPIEVVGCTIDETDQSSAATCANDFVEQGVAAAVVTITAQGATLVPILTDAGIPYVVSGGSSPAESVDGTGLVFSVSGGVGALLGAMAIEAEAQDITKVAFLVTENAAGGVQGLLGIPFGNLDREFEVIPVPPGTPDMTPQVSAALSSGSGAVAVVGDASFCISAIQALESLDPDGEHWLIATCTDQPVIDAVGEAGLDGATMFGASDPESDEPEAVLYRAVMASYAPDTPTEGFAGAGYGTMMALVRGTAEVTGDPTPAAIAAALSATTDVPATSGFGLSWGCAERLLAPLTVCGSELTIGTMDGTRAVDIRLVDAAPAFAAG
jgi:branched-chain amino acid transport system substrate-binding protein